MRNIQRCLLLCLSLISGLVSAHPHAWIDMQTRFLINEKNELTGLDLIWHFDDFYSANIIEDMKQKKVPLAKQYQDFAKQSIDFMASENWLTHLSVDKQNVAFTKPTAYRTEKQDYHLKLHFVLPLKTPILVTGKTFELSIYDNTYYVEMLHHKAAAITVSDDAVSLCKADLKLPQPPKDLSAYAASLDVTQTDSHGLGRQFAEKVILTCHP